MAKHIGIQGTIPLDIYSSSEKSPYPQSMRHLGEMKHPVFGTFDVSFTNETIPKIVIKHPMTGRHSYLTIQQILEGAAAAMMVRADG